MGPPRYLVLRPSTPLGYLHWHRSGDETWTLTPEQFAWLTAGADWQRLWVIRKKKSSNSPGRYPRHLFAWHA
ncbi:transposase [Klebsiella michiganensis]|uniref:transposase n=1 Tax=Klebsiella michiganensis TaxID=1134687 RepID=UPI001D0E0ABA|nr:transposase [Klebsiella michiganensis]